MKAKEMFLNAGQSLLLVVDIQEKLLTTMAEGRRVVDKAAKLIEAAGVLQVPVVVTEHFPRGLGATATALAGPLGAADKIEKICFSCYRQPQVEKRLKELERRQVVLCGMEAHVCVLQTALDLLAAGYHVFVVADAVCSRDKFNEQTALQQVAAAGGVVTVMEAVLFQWLERADRPEFKRILKIIK